MSKNKSKTEGTIDRRSFVAAVASGTAAAGLASQSAAAEQPAAAQPAAAADHTGSIWWNEYLAQDTSRMNYFYSNVMGWKMKLVSLDEPSRLAKPDEKSYMVMMSGAEEVAGVMKIADADFKGARGGWFTYIQVASVDESVARAVQLGGKLVREPVDTNEGVRIAVIEDPEGCLVGLATPKPAA
jgi:predicted enzyme related to lactoylglutathione lyase